MGKKATIIGAGIGGLTTAIYLAHAGWEVEVLEQNPVAGGKIGEIHSPMGSRWDTGPSLFTQADWLNEVLCIDGNTDYKLDCSRLDIVTQYYYADGTQLVAYGDEDAFAKEIELKTEDSAAGVRQYLKRSEVLFDMTEEVFLKSSLHRLKTYLSKAARKAYPKMYKLQPWKSLHNYNRKAFKDKRVQMLFDRFATYNGSHPYKAPATLAIIPHLEHGLGAFYPKGGMFEIVRRLEGKAKAMGVKLEYGQTVTQILVENGEAKGVEVAGEMRRAEAVVSNLDVQLSYERLMPGEKLPKAVAEAAPSTSAMIFYWTVRVGEDNGLAVHNLFFSDSYEAELDSLHSGNKGTYEVFLDPTVYVYVSKKVEHGDAAEGYENWFVMVNTPAIAPEQWSTELEVDYRRVIIQKLEAMLGTTIEAEIVEEYSRTPKDIAIGTGAHLGSLYGPSSNTMWSAFLRHPNASRRIQNMYWVGGTVHPGGGIPLCLQSARIVRDMMGKG